MRTAAEYREEAKRYVTKADGIIHTGRRARLLEMAQSCLRLADQAELLESEGLTNALETGQPMAQYYFFDLVDGAETSIDDVGLKFANLEAARANALLALAEIARDKLPEGDRKELKIYVRDESRQILLTASLELRVDRAA
jgi:hypothetical protein